MTTRSLIIRFPGYPFDPAVLLPDAEMASIAGTLRAHGHRCTILDFGCLEVVRRMAPRWHRAAVERVTDRWLGEIDGSQVSERPSAHPATVAEAHAAFLEQRALLCVEIAEDLVRERWVDFLAFKVVTPDDLETTTLIAREYRARGGRRPVVAFGRLIQRYGPYLSGLRGKVDALCSGPAEGSLLRMAQRVACNRPVNARDLAWVQPAGRSVGPGCRPAMPTTDKGDEILPAYDAESYPVLQGDAKLKLFSLLESTGCDCHCNACPDAANDGNLRLRAPEIVAEEAHRLSVEHGLGAVYLAGRGGAAEHISAVIAAITERVGPVRWGRRLHTGTLALEQLAEWRNLGLESTEFEIDSGSQRLLDDTFGKGVRVSHAEALLRAAAESGMHATARFVFPVPDDDAHTREETLRLLKRTRPGSVRVLMPEVAPGSHWHAHANAFGFESASPWGPYPQGPYGVLAMQRYPLPVREGGVAPYHHGELSPNQAVQAHAALIADIESQGIPSGVGAHLALAARMVVARGEEAAWARALQRALLLGDTDFAEACLAHFNAVTHQPANLVSFPGASGMSRAVGS